MTNAIRAQRIFVALGCFFAAMVPQPALGETVNAAVASNFRHTMEKLEQQFEAQSTVDLRVSYGSTGKLYAQIVAGAPFDIFLAADKDRPSRLVQSGYAFEGFQSTYAQGRLVLWSLNKQIDHPEVALHKDNRVAIANPELAPYGQAAMDVINTYTTADSRPQIVMGENVGQALAFVYTGNADFGLVAQSLVLALPVSKRGSTYVISKDTHAPIEQDMVLLTRSSKKDAAKQFLNYLQSEPAQSLIASDGYDLK